jgi:hypothetical protein
VSEPDCPMGGELEELPDPPTDKDVDWVAASELDFREFD